MKLKKKIFIFILMFSVYTLFGCQSKVSEKAEQIEKELAAKEEVTNDYDLEKMNDFYSDLEEKDINETVRENDLDQVPVKQNKEIEKKAEYEDPNEFASFIADVLFRFYKLSITPEEYYNFILEYGSKIVIDELPNKEDAIKIYETIQDMFKKNNFKIDSYEITDVILNNSQTEGYFYRRVFSSNGEEYYICTIVKENGIWKFVEDSPSPPFKEIGSENENNSSKK